MKSPMAIFFALMCITMAGGAPGIPGKGIRLGPDDIDDVVKPLMQKHRIPGLAVAVSLADGSTIERYYGKANLEYDAAIEKDSVFQIGSVSKTFTGLGIAMLQEQGKLNVSDRLSKYFPEYLIGRDITLRHLLQHTSGIPDITAVEPFKSNQSKNWTPRKIVALLSPLSLEFTPGEKARYSNSGAIFLGLVIEKVTGMPYAEFLKNRIAGPLGQSHTMLGSNSLIVPRRVAGYELAEGKLRNAEYASASAPYASGGIMSTPADLVKLKKAFQPGVLLKKESIEEMFAPVRLNNGQEGVISAGGVELTFGYCLDMVKRGKGFVPGKTGGISGFSCYIAYYREPGAMVALAANLDNCGGPLLLMANGIADRIENAQGPR